MFQNHGVVKSERTRTAGRHSSSVAQQAHGGRRGPLGEALPDGRVRVHVKAPWRRGIAHADMDKGKFLARLCALVPPPNFHMVRHFGVLASPHHLRPRVVPGPGAELPGQQLSLDFAGPGAAEPEGPPESAAPRRIGWASLLARVFAIDVTVCRKCGGRMRILEVVDTPDAFARVLHDARAPPRPPPPGQLVLLH